MKTIEMKVGVWALLDDEDWERLHQHEWKLAKNGYAYRNERREGKTVRIWMHREVMAEELDWRSGHWEVHHWDEVKLNNQRANLLICEPRWHSKQHHGGYLSRKALKMCGTLQSRARHTF